MYVINFNLKREKKKDRSICPGKDRSIIASDCVVKISRRQNGAVAISSDPVTSSDDGIDYFQERVPLKYTRAASSQLRHETG